MSWLIENWLLISVIVAGALAVAKAGVGAWKAYAATTPDPADDLRAAKAEEIVGKVEGVVEKVKSTVAPKPPAPPAA